MGTNYNSGVSNLSPARHRRQKALVVERTNAVRASYERRRAEQAQQARDAAFDRALIQDTICKIKTALNFTVSECERPVWPSGDHRHPKILKQAFVDYAMRYFDPAQSEESFHEQLQYFTASWQIQQWVGARYTLVERIEFDGPWYRTPNRHDKQYPYWADVAYYLDMSRIELVVPEEDKEGLEESSHWRYLRLKPVSLSCAAPVDRETIDTVYQQVFSPEVQLAMADKIQGYVPGEMWWNRLWRFLTFWK
jgi:hypothetical protein